MKSTLLFIGFCLVILSLSIRGLQGNVSESAINSPEWTTDGPFELSPERGRFALTYSLAEHKSFYFSLPIAKFAVPDLGYSHGHYVSLFAPLVSFAAIPGYLLGKLVGASQVGVFAMVAVFGLANAWLIQAIAVKVGAHRSAGILAALSFLFATPAYAYAVTLYQHHLTTFLILSCIYLLLRSKSLLTLVTVFFLCALAVPLDYPNVVFLFPIGVYALSRIVTVTQRQSGVRVDLFPFKSLALMSMVGPLLFFMWFNANSYGNKFQLSGTVPGVHEIDAAGKPALPAQFNLQDSELYLNPDLQKKSAVGFFHTHNMLNGFYIHFLSPDRGIIFYAPVLFIGIIGLVVGYRKKMPLVPLVVAVIGANIILYSMWGDPWGGWAFGSRYLIPTYALVAIFIAVALTRFRTNIYMRVIFFVLFAYSAAVNTLGAITSNANPPQVEILEMERISGKVQKYTYERNWQYLQQNKSKAFVFQAAAKKIVPATGYYAGLSGSIVLAAAAVMLLWNRTTRGGADA